MKINTIYTKTLANGTTKELLILAPADPDEKGRARWIARTPGGDGKEAAYLESTLNTYTEDEAATKAWQVAESIASKIEASDTPASDTPAGDTLAKALAKEKKLKVQEEVDRWLADYEKEQEAAGHAVIIKTWEKIPTCRALRVDNVTYFEIHFSRNGVRLCAKSKLIPAEIRPTGATIIKNGLDLCIPTFAPETIAANLNLYATACANSLAAAKASKQAPKEEPKEQEVISA